MKAIVENGVTLELTTVPKRSDAGVAYWQARYSFPTAMGTARLHGATIALYPSEQAAEQAALNLARRQGWARIICVHPAD